VRFVAIWTRARRNTVILYVQWLHVYSGETGVDLAAVGTTWRRLRSLCSQRCLPSRRSARPVTGPRRWRRRRRHANSRAVGEGPTFGGTPVAISRARALSERLRRCRRGRIATVQARLVLSCLPSLLRHRPHGRGGRRAVPQMRRRGTPLRAVFRSVAIDNASRPRLFPRKVPHSTSIVVVIVFGLESPTTVEVERRYEKIQPRTHRTRFPVTRSPLTPRWHRRQRLRRTRR
jgi:hypothetical protein